MVGTTVVLSDGTIAKSGGKVIKNVAGYDLAKLFAGSFGTLGLIATISVRLHPLAVDDGDRPRLQRRPGRRCSAPWARSTRLPLEADCLDVAWENGSGRVLVRYSGNTAADRARETVARMRAGGGRGDRGRRRAVGRATCAPAARRRARS